MSALKYWLHKKVLLAKKGKTKEEAFERFKETFSQYTQSIVYLYAIVCLYSLAFSKQKKMVLF
jgi:hypothetical protein